eukprot:jgi/Bigna1/140977/aug1.59_g15685
MIVLRDSTSRRFPTVNNQSSADIRVEFMWKSYRPKSVTNLTCTSLSDCGTFDILSGLAADGVDIFGPPIRLLVQNSSHHILEKSSAAEAYTNLIRSSSKRNKGREEGGATASMFPALTSWSLERSGCDVERSSSSSSSASDLYSPQVQPAQIGPCGYYYDSVENAAVFSEPDVLLVLDVLFREVGIIGRTPECLWCEDEDNRLSHTNNSGGRDKRVEAKRKSFEIVQLSLESIDGQSVRISSASEKKDFTLQFYSPNDARSFQKVFTRHFKRLSMESLHALSKDLLAGAYERPSIESQTMPMPQAAPVRIRRARSRSVTFGDSVLRSDIDQALKGHDTNEENEEDESEDKNDKKSFTRVSSAILSSLDTSATKGIDGTPFQSPMNSRKINRQSNVGLLTESYVGSRSSNLLISRSTDEKEEGEEYDSSLAVTITGVRLGKDNTMSYRRVMVICALHDPNGKQKNLQVDSQEAKGFLCIRINFETTAPFAFRTDYQNGHTLRFEVEETQDDKMVAMLPVEDMKKQMNCCCIS